MHGERVGVRDFQRHRQVAVLFELALSDGYLDVQENDVKGHDVKDLVRRTAELYQISEHDMSLCHESGKRMFENDVMQAVYQLGEIERRPRISYEMRDRGWTRVRDELADAVWRLVPDQNSSTEPLLHAIREPPHGIGDETLQQLLLLNVVTRSISCLYAIIDAVKHSPECGMTDLMRLISRAGLLKAVLGRHIVPFPTPWGIDRRLSAVS